MTDPFWLVVGEILGFMGGALVMSQAIPQAWRIYRMDTGYGVSLSAWLLQLYRMAAWLGYGIYVFSPAIMVSNSVALITTGLVIVALVQHRHKAWWWIIPTSIAWVLLVQVIPVWLTGIILVSFTLSRLPQLFVSIQNMKRGKVTAVSISSLAMGAASMLCWGLYGVIHQDPLVMWTTGLAFALMVSVGALEVYTAEKAKRLAQLNTVS